MYKQLILPLFDYSDHIYDGTTQYNKHILQVLQNSAFRCILRADRMTPTSQLHVELDMDRLNIKREKHMYIYVQDINWNLTS